MVKQPRHLSQPARACLSGRPVDEVEWESDIQCQRASGRRRGRGRDPMVELDRDVTGIRDRLLSDSPVRRAWRRLDTDGTRKETQMDGGKGAKDRRPPVCRPRGSAILGLGRCIGSSALRVCPCESVKMCHGKAIAGGNASTASGWCPPAGSSYSSRSLQMTDWQRALS